MASGKGCMDPTMGSERIVLDMCKRKAFHYLSPSFGAIDFGDDAEAGRAYQRLVVGESIIPKMSDSSKEKVALMCEAMKQKLKDCELTRGHGEP
eukprot:3488849-Amphidinium_carterae.4